MKLAKQREWELRVLASPRIPRGDSGYTHTLRIILNHVLNGTPTNEKIVVPGSKTNNNLEELLIRIRPLGIVKKLNSKWEVSEEIKEWVINNDNVFLTSIINGNLKFFVEILDFCNGIERTLQDIIEYAKNEYDLEWKGKSQFLDRIKWLRDIGSIEYIDHKHCYKTNGRGKEILKLVPVIKVNYDNEVNRQLNINLSDMALDSIVHSQELLVQRKVSTGYIPGGLNDLFNTIFECLEFINKNNEERVIYKYYESSYGIKSTSTRSFLHHLMNLKLIERVSLSSYEVTNQGILLLESKNILDLVVFYNNSYKFILELLEELKEPKTRKQLTEIASLSYEIQSNISINISHRLHLLEKAGLIYFYKNNYHLTEGAEKFITHFELELPSIIGNRKNEKEKSEHFTLLNDLNKTSRDSMNPTNFEKAIRNIFLEMGFDSKLIGGAGNTDVLLKSPGSAQYSYTVCVDAKSTYSGAVTDSMVDFDTLKEHKRKHNADYIVIIANTFNSESRLTKRAIEHNVALLDIELLSELYKKHMEIPLSFEEYINIFNQPGVVDIKVLDNKRNEMIGIANLMLSIMDAFINNKDELLTSRDLYWIINVNKENVSKFSKLEIEDMLLFLSSPFIACIEKKKEGYRALGSSQDLKQKFNFFMKNL
ncbi:restriction endonuclease [Salinicoccus carnicancri]|uniref:restriction endonuclease n=1 Tax=Salinicoccus carnicancri TaxID=558170 RepID=UPI0003053D44|nr:restriction endonuclease [Salinicoccus carnicancri]